jgi:O-antigen/teichoic acid export membrane protein
MWVGLKVVPILLLANMFLGIYYNLSIWYKITNKTMAGAYITIIGAVITLIINYFFIPSYGYMACAWATFCCYGTMMVLCYVWGQKEYRVPYAAKKLVAYMALAVLLFFFQRLIIHFWGNPWLNYISGVFILMIFVLFVVKIEKKEFQKLPVVGKYIT